MIRCREILLLSCLIMLFWRSATAERSENNIHTAHMDVKATPNIPDVEMDALYDLYIKTNGYNWTWSPNVTDIGSYTHTNGVPWNFSDVDANPCTDNWQGINCSFVPPYQIYHIAEIVLVTHNLRGQLPPTISNLSRLKYLNLAYNYLTGTVPAAVYTLTRLISLNLGNNNLHGRFPVADVSNSILKEIYVNRNQMTGPFPMNLAALPNLGTLGLDNNQFSGTLPKSIDEFTRLQRLFIDHNAFEGALPVQLCVMTTLTEVRASSNLFTGTVPSCVGNLTGLVEFRLQYNYLTGTIPAEMTNLVKLQLFYLNNNMLTGSIPTGIGHMSQLISISFQYNYLMGPLPESLGELRLLTNLYVENNHLTGTLPVNFGGMEQLIFAYLSYNHLEGTLPRSVSRLAELTSLFLNDNAFTGSLDGVFNATAQRFITTIQVSDNQFTGTLPAEVFSIDQLSTFAAVSNCFSGSIPRSICGSPALTTLILDGLRSARSCRNTIFPGLSSRYVLEDRIEGGLPECLFGIPTLRTLHLSGNGLTGPLPDDVAIRSGLLDFSVSHNELTGTIPQVFQSKRWSNLDLSYNRFSGSLLLDNALAEQNHTKQVSFYNVTLTASSVALSLRNNRLSGNLPPIIDQIVNISVLDGNLFACNLAQSDLPPHDQGAGTYQCGSNSFNIAYYTWLATVCVFVGGTFLALWFRNELIGGLGLERVAYYYDKWMHHIEFTPDRDSSVNQHLRNYKYVMYVNAGVCRMSLLATVCIVVFLVPIYFSCTHWYGTHQFEYAWSVSAAFLSGPTAMSLLLVSFVLLLAFTFVLFTVHIRRYKASVQEHFRSSSAAAPRRTSAIRRLMSKDTDADKPRKPVKLRYKILVYLLFFTINTVVVLGVNVAYVYIRLYESSRLLVLAQLLLSVFKVVWNSLCSVYIERYTIHYLAEASKDDWKEKDASFFAIQLFVSLFNYIAIPCLVVGVISPDCYQNLIININPVSSRFTFQECELFSSVAGCLRYARQVMSTSFNPPFTYSYQCSSSLITFYAPTYVYVSFIVTFLNPVLELVSQKLHQYTRYGKWWSGQLDYWVPLILQLVSRETEEGKPPYDILNPYFDANLLLVTNLTYLGVLLTFGVVFPPLAACLMVAIYASTYNAKMLVGRFTCNAIAAELHYYIDIIEEECEGVASAPKLYQSLRLLLAFSFCFYTPFLFDTLGDSEGLHRSYWVLFFLPLLVFVCVVIKYALKKWCPELLRPHSDPSEERQSHLRSLELPRLGPAFPMDDDADEEELRPSVEGNKGEGTAEVSLSSNRLSAVDSAQSGSGEVTFNVLRNAVRAADGGK